MARVHLQQSCKDLFDQILLDKDGVIDKQLFAIAKHWRN